MTESNHLFQEKAWGNKIFVKFELEICWCDLENKVKVTKILINFLFLKTMYLCQFGENPPDGSLDRAQKRIIF